MRQIKLGVATALAMAMTASLATAQNATQAGVAGVLPDGKIAVINTAVFQEKIGELKQKYEQVNNQFQDRYKELQSLNNQVTQMENDLTTKASVLPAEKVQEMRDQFEAMKKQGQRKYEDFQTDISKALDSQTKPVRDKLGQFIQNYASQRGIILIIRLPEAYQTGTLAFAAASVDITDDFINEYNKANPVPVTTTPATKPGTPTTQPATRPGTTTQPATQQKPKPE
jgi:Skp family chaperone for outer membrane proteins